MPPSPPAKSLPRVALAPCLLVLALLLCPLAPHAQQKPSAPAPPGQEIDEDEVLRIDTDLVLVDVLVTDAEGRPVRLAGIIHPAVWAGKLRRPRAVLMPRRADVLPAASSSGVGASACAPV